jgi:hypothetical protein
MAEAGEILVLGQEGESIHLGILPDEFIGRMAESNRMDVY